MNASPRRCSQARGRPKNAARSSTQQHATSHNDARNRHAQPSHSDAAHHHDLPSTALETFCHMVIRLDTASPCSPLSTVQRMRQPVSQCEARRTHPTGEQPTGRARRLRSNSGQVRTCSRRGFRHDAQGSDRPRNRRRAGNRQGWRSCRRRLPSGKGGMAEREGFEPPVSFHPQRFSRPPQ